MRKYYSGHGVDLYHGDALDVLAGLDPEPVTAIVCDPPYASGSRTEASRPSSGAMVRGVWNSRPIDCDQMTTAGYVWLMRHVVGALVPRLVDGGSALLFVDWRQWPNLVGAVESVNLRVQGMVVWDKASFGLGKGYRLQHELICHAAKGTPVVRNSAVSNVLRHPRCSNREHPSPKPVALLADLVRVVAGHGDLVIDPFAGCGPTLEACAALGVRAVGVELDEGYCEIAARRLSSLVVGSPAEDPKPVELEGLS